MKIWHDVPHYSVGGVEVIEIIKTKMPPDISPFEGFLWGNILKYLFRYRLKGDPRGDLLKAQTYLTWLIEATGGE